MVSLRRVRYAAGYVLLAFVIVSCGSDGGVDDPDVLDARSTATSLATAATPDPARPAAPPEDALPPPATMTSVTGSVEQPPGPNPAAADGTASGRTPDAVPADDLVTAPATHEVPADLMGQILQHAASYAGVETNELRVSMATAVTWNDGSLGCRESGSSYLQVLTPGFHVVLAAPSLTLDYRAAEDGYFKLCQPIRENPLRP